MVAGSVAALAIGGCGGGQSKSSAQPSPSATAAKTAVASTPVKLTEGVRKVDVTVTGQKVVHFRPSVTVRPGDVVQIQAVAAGAPSNVHVTLQKGPSTTLVAEAQAGGRSSRTARIRSASGTPITLTLARYTCVIGATRFCEHIGSTETRRSFSATARGVPSGYPVQIAATVASPSGG